VRRGIKTKLVGILKPKSVGNKDPESGTGQLGTKRHCGMMQKRKEGGGSFPKFLLKVSRKKEERQFFQLTGFRGISSNWGLANIPSNGKGEAPVGKRGRKCWSHGIQFFTRTILTLTNWGRGYG